MANGKTKSAPAKRAPSKPAAPKAAPQKTARQKAAPAKAEGVVLTEEQRKRRRARSIAIASVLGFLVLLFYVVTIVKLGPNVLNRPL